MEAGVNNPLRTILTIVMDVLVAVAIALTLRIIVLFFGQLAVQPWARAIVNFTSILVLPLGMHPIKTPYGGIFDVNAAITIVIVLVAEWVLSVIRSR